MKIKDLKEWLELLEEDDDEKEFRFYFQGNKVEVRDSSLRTDYTHVYINLEEV